MAGVRGGAGALLGVGRPVRYTFKILFITLKWPRGQVFAAVSELFGAWDGLCAAHGVTKIETVGDAYWAAVGLGPEPATPADARRLLRLAAAMQARPLCPLGPLKG